jgi:bifunctional UDP-N-acetylglucosamine pyrophosphorylase/glucosamine-1-phosphate N-acetyltransferase
MRIAGIYLFSKDFISRLVGSEISEYLLEGTLDMVAKERKVGFVRLQAAMPSVKYPWDLLDLKQFIFNSMPAAIDPSAIVEKTVLLKGDNIYIGKNAHVYDYAIVEGPAYIGENAVVGAYCIVRGGSILENGAQIERYCDLRNSIIGENSRIHSGFIGDSVIGKDCRIGAEFITANKKLDRSNIGVYVKDEKIDSGRVAVGCFLGDNVKVGIRVSVMPGTTIGKDSVIYPGLQIKGTFKTGSKLESNS